MKKLLGKILCLIGRHDWFEAGKFLAPEGMPRSVYYKCRRFCGESKAIVEVSDGTGYRG